MPLPTPPSLLPASVPLASLSPPPLCSVVVVRAAAAAAAAGVGDDARPVERI